MQAAALVHLMFKLCAGGVLGNICACKKNEGTELDTQGRSKQNKKMLKDHSQKIKLKAVLITISKENNFESWDCYPAIRMASFYAYNVLMAGSSLIRKHNYQVGLLGCLTFVERQN